VLWLEKMQESGEMSWQAKISVAAISSTTTVATRLIVNQCAISCFSILTYATVRWVRLVVSFGTRVASPGVRQLLNTGDGSGSQCAIDLASRY
jgi:hypothetical protein